MPTYKWIEISKSPSRRDSCKRCSPRISKINTSPTDGHSDLEGKMRCQLHFRQQFWRVISSGSMVWEGYSEDQDQLLKACSDKLTELKKKHKLKKIKYAENAALSVPKLFFANRRLRRKSRSFNLGRSLSIKGEQDIVSVNNESSKKKGSSEPDQKEESSKKKGKSKKFRKGGIVSLATVHKVHQECNSEESNENQTGKKKKKKKKLNQLHKRVKNAMQTVSMVTLSNKKSDKTSSANKRSSVP